MSHAKPMRPLLIGHLLGIVSLALGMGVWIWVHTPARALYAHYSARSGNAATAALSAIARAADAVTGDLAFTAATLAFFAFGTRVYTKKLQNWLDARGAGSAETFGSQGLEGRAIEANRRDMGVAR